ncbi:phosphohydrolase [Psychromonas marina]|uniref:Phosphohydrolase n=1 Tax=Psychromonas marina TaxID=88364 RepID=A0ABQ6E265_9GAMM|nr:HD domain-containing protein [Psychromonas marina]GLS91422.1 phosphohydrolase [Psychromonas marina]
MEELNQQLDFIMELDRLKGIYRQTTVKSDNDRYENSAEHSWQISLAAHVLQKYAVEDVNITRVMNMLLIHDIVEIDAGDLFAFSAEQDHAAQEEKEMAAAERIFGLLPEKQCQQFKSLWVEFENAQTIDARFAKAMDRILPLLQNMRNEGGSWVRHKVKKSQVLQRNNYLQGLAPGLWLYACEQVDIAVSKGWLIDE